MEFINSVQQVKTNWQPYKKWEAEQNDKEFQRKELIKRVPVSGEELKKASQYGRTLIDAINVMDQYSINKAEDVEMASKVALSSIDTAVGVASIAGLALIAKRPSVKKYLAKESIGSTSKVLLLTIPTICPALVVLPFFTVKFAGYEKEASRIARYQAREEELKDPENFVIYNENQIAEAKKIALTLPNPTEKKKNKLSPINTYGDSVKSIKSLVKDHQNYLQWKQINLKNEKNKMNSLNATSVSEKQLQKAKNDQDNLLRTIRKIELNSQNYLTNMEMACNIVLGSELLIGAIGGGIASGITHLLQKTKLISDTSNIANKVKTFAPAVVPLILVVATALYTTKLQKEAAKIGRFKAKQELLNDPYSFITYSDKQLDSVRDLKAPAKLSKGFFGKFKEDIKFFFQLQKDYKEYQKYKKTEYVEEQKLQKALKEVKVSDNQIKEAKAFQKKAFMAFEKIDEMTQRYVDDTEAATDIGKQYVNSASNLISTALFLPLVVKASTGVGKIKDFLFKSLPVFAPILVQVPTEIKATQIKKEAAKIGTMKAMQALEDPRCFIDEE